MKLYLKKVKFLYILNDILNKFFSNFKIILSNKNKYKFNQNFKGLKN